MLRLKHETEGSWALSFSLNDVLVDAISEREVSWLESAVAFKLAKVSQTFAFVSQTTSSFASH